MKLEVGTVIKFKSQVFNYHGCIEEAYNSTYKIYNFNNIYINI